jgi:hypothetical protein
VNPYARFTTSGQEHRRFFEELRQWHDEMVLHQRHVRRVGSHVACSDECPHAEGRRLREATALLGSEANNLTFLRSCAGSASPRRREGARAGC